MSLSPWPGIRSRASSRSRRARSSTGWTGALFGIPGQVLRLSARVEHGNSGGPVLDRYGKVVGVVYAIEVATGFGLAIPVDTLRSLARTGGFEAVPPCGSG